MVVWKPYKKYLFYDKNVLVSNGPPNHVIRPFENRTKSVWKVQCSDFRCSSIKTISKPNFQIKNRMNGGESGQMYVDCTGEFEADKEALVSCITFY